MPLFIQTKSIYISTIFGLDKYQNAWHNLSFLAHISEMIKDELGDNNEFSYHQQVIRH